MADYEPEYRGRGPRRRWQRKYQKERYEKTDREEQEAYAEKEHRQYDKTQGYGRQRSRYVPKPYKQPPIKYDKLPDGSDYAKKIKPSYPSVTKSKVPDYSLEIKPYHPEKKEKDSLEELAKSQLERFLKGIDAESYMQGTEETHSVDSQTATEDTEASPEQSEEPFEVVEEGNAEDAEDVELELPSEGFEVDVDEVDVDNGILQPDTETQPEAEIVEPLPEQTVELPVEPELDRLEESLFSPSVEYPMNDLLEAMDAVEKWFEPEPLDLEPMEREEAVERDDMIGLDEVVVEPVDFVEDEEQHNSEPGGGT